MFLEKTTYITNENNIAGYPKREITKHIFTYSGPNYRARLYLVDVMRDYHYLEANEVSSMGTALFYLGSGNIEYTFPTESVALAKARQWRRVVLNLIKQGSDGEWVFQLTIQEPSLADIFWLDTGDNTPFYMFIEADIPKIDSFVDEKLTIYAKEQIDLVMNPPPGTFVMLSHDGFVTVEKR